MKEPKPPCTVRFYPRPGVNYPCMKRKGHKGPHVLMWDDFMGDAEPEDVARMQNELDAEEWRKLRQRMLKRMLKRVGRLEDEVRRRLEEDS